MSIPSNDKIASLALKIAGEVYTGGCIDCGSNGVEFHEILKRTMRPILGSTVAILGVTLAPLCQKCHRKWEKMTTDEQLRKLYVMMLEDGGYAPDIGISQRDQLIALKSRCCKA